MPLNHYKPVHIRQVDPQSMYGQGGGSYGGGAGFDSQPPAPFAPEGQYLPYLPGGGQTSAQSGSGGLFSNLNLKDIKTVIDRMGGIDGVLNTVSKVHKVVQAMQQFAPLLKLLIPRLGGKAADQDDGDSFADDYVPRRRRKPRTRYRYRSGRRRPPQRRRTSSYYSQKRPAARRSASNSRPSYRRRR